MTTPLSIYEQTQFRSAGIPESLWSNPDIARSIYGDVMNGASLQQAMAQRGVDSTIPVTQNTPTSITPTPSGNQTTTTESQEGASRINPNTGQQEFLSPDGTWQPVTTPGQVYGTENQTPTQVTDLERQIAETRSQMAEAQARIDAMSAAGVTDEADLPLDTGDTAMDKQLQIIEDYLKILTAQNKTINTAIEITPEKVMEFLKMAEKDPAYKEAYDLFQKKAGEEIDPYYASQLAIARDSIARSQNYSTEDVALFEADLEKKYGKSLTNLGENMAEQGFAQSGRRITEESDLAYDTQQAINSNRRKLSFEAGNQAAEFAQNWGSSNLTNPTIGNAPTVKTGELSFAKPTGVSNLYTLNPNVYSNLTGAQQYNQQVAKRTRASELESAFRTFEENKLRNLQV